MFRKVEVGNGKLCPREPVSGSKLAPLTGILRVFCVVQPG